MPQFAANLSMLFTEHALIDRFAAAREAGFSKVEIQFPYELSIEQVRNELTKHNQQLVLINLPAGDWAAGDRGIACQQARQAEFNAGIQEAKQWVEALNIPMVNCLAGIAPADQTDTISEQIFTENLIATATQLNTAGARLLIEAINTVDIPGFWLNTSSQAVEIIKKLDKLNVAFQYDVYHMQIMEGNLINTLRSNIEQVGHIQIADVPGRHEPGTGEINFSNLFKALDAMGYSGLISLEYNPAGQTVDGLHWLSQTD